MSRFPQPPARRVHADPVTPPTDQPVAAPPPRRVGVQGLNPAQAETLRNADPGAYASYAAAYGQLVDQVAQVADRLGEKVDQFQRQGCVDLGPGP